METFVSDVKKILRTTILVLEGIKKNRLMLVSNCVLFVARKIKIKISRRKGIIKQFIC